MVSDSAMVSPCDTQIKLRLKPKLPLLPQAGRVPTGRLLHVGQQPDGHGELAPLIVQPIERSQQPGPPARIYPPSRVCLAQALVRDQGFCSDSRRNNSRYLCNS